ncbi:aldose 1-epimerase family protein [Microbacterium sp. NPDC076911]|uniref:aldose 1-epimerase family protein n=1 Tax=Microbacterium sp. NPDC076911 TaxID=3154958 RepID=UPI0034426861
MSSTPTSGTQHALRAGDYEAVIASVGATLRTLTFEGRDLVVPFAADEVRPAYRGVTLAPWPNRVTDGHYRFDGADYQLALTEPARNHALHGLAAWLDFEAIDKGPSHVALTATIPAQTSYPWRILIRTTFTLTSEGLTQHVEATNEAGDAAPFGTGPHPYLVAGPGCVDEWVLELPASQVLAVTQDRLIPERLEEVDAVDATRFDFRVPRTIGAAEIDHAYTGLVRDAERRATVNLRDPHGRGVSMSWDASCPWVQVHTTDTGNPATHRIGLAVEPMTCAPDAFNDAVYDYDTGLIVIEPGGTTVASWRISAL